MEKEIWKDIEGYEGLYQVSNFGRVRSFQRLKSHILRSATIKGGYNIVVLTNCGKKKCIYVHRLVAMAFIPNPNEYSEINHKDEDKTNNHVDNLEWCSRVYNMNYGTVNERHSATCLAKNGGMPKKYYERKTDNRITIIKDDRIIKNFKNYSEAAKFLNVSVPTVSNRVNNDDRKPILGYILVKSSNLY